MVILSAVLPLAVVAGIFVGIVTAVRASKNPLSKAAQHILIGIVGLVLVCALAEALL
jgi:VIT1/CCC1 family predicted Fe2+/Mn2+ transporter